MENIVQVLIPAMNRHSRLDLTLDSLRRCSIPEGWNLRITVCDDGSDPPLKDICSKYDADWIYHGRNYGTSQARRTLYAHATGVYIWLLDSDMYVHPLSVHGYLSTVKEGVAVAGRMCGMGDIEAEKVLAMPAESRLAYLEARDNTIECRHDWPCEGRLSAPWDWAFTGNQCIWGSDFRKSGGVPHEFQFWGYDDKVLVWNICKRANVSYVTSETAKSWHVQRDLIREGNGGFGYSFTAGNNAPLVNKWMAEHP